MYINAVGHFIPSKRIPNEYFADVNGLSSEWIYQRTGIRSRSRSNEDETINQMCKKAVENALPCLPYDIKDVDLIIFASYTPSDTVVTAAHYIQNEYNISNAKAFYISSACSSGINAIETINAYLTTQMATKALLICADRNSAYSDESDCTSGHLWGDAAVAFFFSKKAEGEKIVEILDITTQGLGHIGKGQQAVSLNPQNGGIQMPFGKDVFMQACTYLTQNTKDIVEFNGYSLSELSYFIGHQANMRILKNVMIQLEVPEEKSLSNIEELGNTGSPSSLLVFAQNYERFNKNDLICISVFGGGYSAGSCLLRIR